MNIMQVLLNFIDIFSGCIGNTKKLYAYIYYGNFINSDMAKILMIICYLIPFIISFILSSTYFYALYFLLLAFNFARIGKLKKDSTNKSLTIDWSKYSLILATILIPFMFAGIITIIGNFNKSLCKFADFIFTLLILNLYLKQRKFTKKLLLEI